MGIGAGYLLLRVAFDAVFLAVQGFPPGASPVWRSEGSWAHLVNAALIGYLPAALAIPYQREAR